MAKAFGIGAEAHQRGISTAANLAAGDVVVLVDGTGITMLVLLAGTFVSGAGDDASLDPDCFDAGHDDHNHEYRSER